MVHTLAENVGIELSDFAIRLVDLADVEKSEEELDATLAAKVHLNSCVWAADVTHAAGDEHCERGCVRQL